MAHDPDTVRVRDQTEIKTPDQLQQAKRPDDVSGVELEGDARDDWVAPMGGVLHELKTDRAHD